MIIRINIGSTHVRILSSDHSNDDNNHVDATDDAFYGGTSLDTDVDK